MFVTTVSFPGVIRIEGFSATINHGITPGTIMLKIMPQDVTTIPVNGTFTVNYADGVVSSTIQWLNCNVDSASYQFNASGQVISLVIKDFRWQWQFGQISGEFNITLPSGKIRVIGDAEPSATDAIGNSEKTPRELATLCLEAMGVTTFDVSDLPNDTRPRISWDYANPAQELQSLVDSLGCSVVPQVDGSVKICKLGDGATLPVGSIESTSQTLNPLDRPKQLVIVSAPVRVQLDFELEAVGEEIDGTIKPLAELSYAPAGWGTTKSVNVLSSEGPKEVLQVVEKSILKWYRVKLPDFTDTELEDLDIDYIEQLLPVIEELSEVASVSDDEKPKKAFVYGKWYHEKRRKNTVEDIGTIDAEDVEGEYADTIIGDGFSIDPERGLVKFSKRVSLAGSYGGSNALVFPAELKLRACCNIKQISDGAPMRYQSSGTSVEPTSPAGNRYEVKDDIKPFQIIDGEGGQSNNIDEVVDMMSYYVDALMEEYAITTADTATYVGILPVTLDGAICTATWSFDGSGATTEINRNDDPGNDYTPPFKVRKRNAALNKVVRGA